MIIFIFFFNDTATTEIYTLSLHDALPISLEHELSADHADIRIRQVRDKVAHRERVQWLAGVGEDEDLLAAAGHRIIQARRLSAAAGKGEQLHAGLAERLDHGAGRVARAIR